MERREIAQHERLGMASANGAWKTQVFFRLLRCGRRFGFVPNAVNSLAEFRSPYFYLQLQFGFHKA